MYKQVISDMEEKRYPNKMYDGNAAGPPPHYRTMDNQPMKPMCYQPVAGPGQNPQVQYMPQGDVEANKVQVQVNDYRNLSIFSIWCCVFLCGLMSVIHSIECRAALLMNNIPLALEKSRQAKKCGWISIVLGILIIASVIGLIIYQYQLIYHFYRRAYQ